MSLQIRLQDNASQPVRDILLVRGQRGYAVAAVAMAERIKEHFVIRDAMPNSKGWPKTHFFAKARQQTHYSHTPDSASVAISLVGFGTYFSGLPQVIKPVNSKLLTIPARPEAYGRRAREFSDLVFRIVINELGQEQPALVRAEQTQFRFGKKRKDGTRKILGQTFVGGEVFFWLAHEVHPKAHPDALPTTEQLQEAVTAELEALLDDL